MSRSEFADVVLDSSGNIVPSATVRVKNVAADGSQLGDATIYVSETGIAKANPFTTGSDGFIDFWATSGARYNVIITASGFAGRTVRFEAGFTEINPAGQGSPVASASTIAISSPYTHITGTGTINDITGMSNGNLIHLYFDGAATVKHATGNIRLLGSADWVATAGYVLSLLKDSDGNWYEQNRQIIVPRAIATVATTVAGLGTATDGKIGLIRGGSSPYEFMHVVYDATYGKWVGQVFTGYITNPGANLASSPAAVGNQLPIGPFKDLWDATLRPQFRHSLGAVSASTGRTFSSRIRVHNLNPADTAAGTSLGVTASHTTVGATTSYSYISSPWDQPSLSAPAKSHAWLIFEIGDGAGASDTAISSVPSNQASMIQLQWRWVG